MPSITIKNVPEPLYERLKEAAVRNRRSLSSEVIVQLERALQAAPVDAEALLERARAVRGRGAIPYLSDTALRSAREEGRA